MSRAPAADPGASLRTLRAGEREAWLALLGGWELPDGWRGRAADFFRRYADWDPTFRDENVWLAEREGRLAATVQIFPRLLRVRGAAVPTGGIGSVFTRPEARGGGLASALLERAQDAMRRRGMELSLLFASRHDFYGRLGWSLWTSERPLLLRGGWRPDGPKPAPFRAARDLADAMALHEIHSARLDGTVIRDAALWRGHLRFAGNPDEDFVLARDAGGRLLAYARGVVLDGVYVHSEWARLDEPLAVGALADLVCGLQLPRDPDPLARGRSSDELRRVAVGPPVRDAALFEALAARGVDVRSFEGRDAMLCCLDPRALGRRLGDPPARGETPDAYLRRVLPPESAAFWPADRF